jgi:site-specific recombinase XerD
LFVQIIYGGGEMEQNNELGALIEQVLFSLEQGGMSANAISYCRRSGYNVIFQYHKEQGLANYSYEACLKLIQKLRVRCEENDMPKHRWRVVRRCAEVLRYFQETGSTGLPNLPKWELVNGPLRKTPTIEQFANKDDLFALVWNIKCELIQTGIPRHIIMEYIYGGFNKIIRHCMLGNVAVYDKTEIEDFVIDAHCKYKSGVMSQTAFTKLRKAAALIHEYHATASIQRRAISQWGVKRPCEYFVSVLSGFCYSMEAKKQWFGRSASSAQQAISQFLLGLEAMGHDCFQNVTRKVVNDCICTLAKRYTSGLKPTLSYIRAFLRYLTEQGISNTELVTAVPENVSPKRAVYDGFSSDEIEKLLAAIDRSTPRGKRDYAMLLIGVKTGLRAIDVVKLERQDIDWHANTINIVQSKTKRQMGIHLSAEVGNAIADYILNGRPCCDCPNIFIRTVYPKQPLSAAAAGGLVRAYSRKAELPILSTRPVGFHTLRRSFGASLLRAEVPVDVIQELLGQSDLNSVQPYLAANEEGLKKCAIGLLPLSPIEEGKRA